ncbi:MAG: hypothetical protein IPP57_11790 [Candidatus Obscuribacter sp.]|nr:hypothetical protein [Candidatus Obscuribacter sp.]
MFKKMLALYPTGKLLGFALQSVSDYFAYVYYENGKLVREYSGASEMGMIFDSGDPQREEMPYYENSEFVDGERVFKTISGTETYQEKGETMGMLMIHDICKKFLVSHLISRSISTVFRRCKSNFLPKENWEKFLH